MKLKTNFSLGAELVKKNNDKSSGTARAVTIKPIYRPQQSTIIYFGINTINV